MPAPTATLDRRQLSALLKCYFRLSTRGRVSQSIGSGPVVMTVMYALVGLAISLITLSAEIDVFTFAILVHSVTFLVVGMAVTAESGDILFNVHESEVLVHRPIHPRTLLLAKAINLLAFTLVVAGALNLFPVFFGLAARDAHRSFPAVHVLSTIVLCVFCAAAVVCSYGLAIRLFDREQLDRLATWSQVAMSIVFIAGYQVMPRLMQRFQGQSLESQARYLWPLPPGWFAAMDSWAASDRPPAAMLPMTLVGLAATAILAYVATARLAPSYTEGLSRLRESRSRAATPASAGRRPRATLNPILRWWLRDPVERSVFRLAAVYMRRDRDLKLRLYPSLSIYVVFPLFGLFDPDRTFFLSLVPVTIWMLGVMPLSALEALRLSSHFAAAELFFIAPLPSAAPVYHGVRKAVLYYLLVPAIGIAAVASAFLVPADGSLLLAVPVLIAIPALSLLPGLVQPYLPLSRPAVRGEQTARNVGLMVTTMLAMGGLLALSWTALSRGMLWELVALETVVMALLYWAFDRSIRNRRLLRIEPPTDR